MKYSRDNLDTWKHPAQLGFGTLRLPVEKDVDIDKIQLTIDEYMKDDFCYFDVHPGYVNGQAERIIRELVVKKYPRDSFLIANKMPYYHINQYLDYEIIFFRELNSCGVEYFDYYMLHALTKTVWDMHKKLDGFSFLRKMKKEGKIKKIGFSFHDKAELLEEILKQYPDLDFIQLQINFLDWESELIDSKRCYELASKYNKDIIVMGPIKGGSLVKEFKIDNKVISTKEIVKLSLEFVASLPNVKIILSGMLNSEQVKENRSIIANAKHIKDYSIYNTIRDYINNLNSIGCTSCNYCVRECPKHIDIPKIIELLNTQNKMGNRSFGGKNLLYTEIVKNKGAANECIVCRKCEEKCPQKLEISTYMKEAAKAFKKNVFDAESDALKSVSRVRVEKETEGLHKSALVPLRIRGKKKNIVLWGSGNCFKRYYGNILKHCNPICICDNDSSKWNRNITTNLTCIAPVELNKFNNIFVVIMVYNTEEALKIANQLIDMGIIDFDICQNWIEYADKKNFY